MSRRGAGSDERGFALLAVILVLALMAVVATELARSMRLEARMVLAYKDSVLATHLAEAAVEQALREILSDAQVNGLDDGGQVVFYRVPTAVGATAPVRLSPLPRTRVPLGAGEFSYRITDEEARLNLNAAGPERVDRLLLALGLGKRERDIITDSLEDWRDANDTYRSNGAESEDTYLRLPVPYRARNADLQDTAELLQIKGITAELYRGAGDKPGLVDVVTTRSRGTVNLNTAAPAVLEALGLSQAEIGDIVQSRTSAPYTAIPARFAGRGLGVGTATFRIEAEGWLGGQPKVRVVTVVQRVPQVVGGGATQSAARGILVYSWRSLPPVRETQQ
jgi:general secretion pathway protein K